MEKENIKPIVFAFYVGNKLLGYRLDTFGSLGFKNPKIYNYSKEQVQTVINNVEYNFKHDTNPIASYITGIDDSIGAQIELVAKEVNQTLTENPVVQMRVLRSPGYTWDYNADSELYCLFDYPQEEMTEWLQNTEDHEVVESHYFNKNGLMNLN